MLFDQDLKFGLLKFLLLTRQTNIIDHRSDMNASLGYEQMLFTILLNLI